MVRAAPAARLRLRRLTQTTSSSAQPPNPRLGLLTGFLLLVGTGYTDAYTFLRHGHVFAEAMTGNLVLIGVGAVSPAIVAFWRPLLSYAAFLGGVVVLWLTSRAERPTDAHTVRPQLAALTCVIAVLVAVGFLPPSAPQELIVALIAFTAGLQISAFRRVDAAPLSTVVMTTNSMHAVGDVLAALGSHDREATLRARALLVSIFGFLVGVFAGAGLSSLMADRASWPDAAIFLVVGVLFTEHDRGGARGTGASSAPHASNPT